MANDPLVIGPPLAGEWIAARSPGSRVPSHGTHLLATTYAFDFVMPDASPRQFALIASRIRDLVVGRSVSKFPCWGGEGSCSFRGHCRSGVRQDGGSQSDESSTWARQSTSAGSELCAGRRQCGTACWKLCRPRPGRWRVRRAMSPAEGFCPSRRRRRYPRGRRPRTCGMFWELSCSPSPFPAHGPRRRGMRPRSTLLVRPVRGALFGRLEAFREPRSRERRESPVSRAADGAWTRSPMDHIDLIAARMERARAERGIPVAELARRVGIDRKRLWRVLNGERAMRADEFVRLCAFFGMGIFRPQSKARGLFRVHSPRNSSWPPRLAPVPKLSEEGRDASLPSERNALDRGGGSAARLRLRYAPCGGYPAPLGVGPPPPEDRGGEPEDGKAPEATPCANVRPGDGVR